MSRTALLTVGAVVAAVLVLASAALRSGPAASPPASFGSSTSAGSPALASLPPAPTAESTAALTPAPPEPTAISGLRGEFVGVLGHVKRCPVIYERDGVLELVLPAGYRSRIRAGAIEIIGPSGAVQAAEGDLLGVNGTVREGGSFCMRGPQLHVSKIVAVRPRTRG